jgi:Lipase (class 3)
MSHRCSSCSRVGQWWFPWTAWQFCLLLLVAVLLQSPPPVTSAYTIDRLQRLAQASSLAYLPMDKMHTSPYLESSGLTPLGEVVDPATESGATVFADYAHQELVVACRGSANPRNFGTNLKFNLVPATRLSQRSVPREATVHQGFQEASVGLWQKLGPPILETLKRQPLECEIKDVVFTGHSLGAATALLCAVHYASTQKDPDFRNAWILPKIVTFGGPKLCNGSLARFLRNGPLQGVDILHLVHAQDPILVNNERLWKQMGFENVGIEMECDPKSPTIYCAEDDDQCAVYGAPPAPRPPRMGMQVAWNIMNHCNYMGIFIGPRMMAAGMGGGPQSQTPGASFNTPGRTIRSDQDPFRR